MKRVQKHYRPLILAAVILIAALAGGYYYYHQSSAVALIDSKANMPYLANIVAETEQNTNFRKVLFTGTRSQLVIMSIPPGGEVGAETHTYTEQTLFFLSGTGEAILNGKTSPIAAGDVVVVTPGTQHNFINTGTVPLKIYTVYAPPNHIDGTIEATKADADANVADEAYGEQAK
ncbi:MAG TPA: cupin domain-containing protein [Candidatus Paceibacterota bacterium]